MEGLARRDRLSPGPEAVQSDAIELAEQTEI